MKKTLAIFKEHLYQAFYDWIRYHKQIIGGRKYSFLLKKSKKGWEKCNNAVDLIGMAM
ncbi:MAG: hypothetical protein U9O89_06585 [Thermoproteota archaeon]|nr:hypothetical protein [Thermoproteota archaeon]